MVVVGTADVRSVVVEGTSWGIHRCADRSIAIPLGRLDDVNGSGAGTADLVRECIRRFRQVHDRLGVQRTLLVIDERRYEVVRAAGLVQWMAGALASEVMVDRVPASMAALARAVTNCGVLERPTLLVELDEGRVRVAEVLDGQLDRAAQVPLPSLSGLGALARTSDAGRLLEVARAAVLPVVQGRDGAGMPATVAAGRDVHRLGVQVASRWWQRDVATCGRVTVPIDTALELARELATRPADVSPGPGQGSSTELAGTALVLAGVAAAMGAESVTCTDARPLDGHLLQMLPGRVVDDLASRFVDAMGRPPTEHAEQVAHLAGALFEGLAGHTRLEEHDRQVLEAAALVHDVARDGGAGDHRRGARQVLAWPVRGVDPATQVEVATLVRAQRGRSPGGHVPGYVRLPAARRSAVARLVPLLRLADGLDCGDDRVVQAVHVEGDREVTCIHVVGDRVDLALHGARRHAWYAEQVLGTSVVIRHLVAAVGDGPRHRDHDRDPTLSGA